MQASDAQFALEAYERAIAQKSELVAAFADRQRAFDSGEMRGMYRLDLVAALREVELEIEHWRAALYG